MPDRVETDDDIYRFQSTWLGPDEWTLPFHARYLAYVLFAALFALVVLFKAVTPFEVGIPPLWEFSIAVLGSSLIMNAVDHDKPIAAVVRTTTTAVLRPRPTNRPARRRPATRRMKITREPLA